MYHADLSETKEQEQKGRDDLSKREVYEQKTEELILPIVEGNGFELVDVEYVKKEALATCALISINREECSR